MKDIVWSIDASLVGLYIWMPFFCLRIGGSEAEDSYSGAIAARYGMAIVLPGYKVFSTYRGSFDTTPSEYEVLIEAMENPCEPSERVKQAVTRYKETVRWDEPFRRVWDNPEEDEAWKHL